MKNPIVYRIIMGIIACSLMLIAISYWDKKNNTKEDQKIDITMQIERLEEGDSITLSNLVYPHVFESIKLQLQAPKKLISRDEKIYFGLNEYDWLAHTIGDNNYLKEFAMEQEDHLVHYKVKFRKELKKLDWI